jgi:hypothetical protein
LPALFLASCRRDPSETFDDARRAVRSWSATLAMAAREWDRGRVPALYVRQTIDAARQSLGEQKKKLKKAPPDPRRDGLKREIAQLRKRARGLSDAVEHDDRRAAASVADALRVDLNLTSPAPGSQGGEGS